ncbi:hypothetical protein ACFQ60_16625 [Streptomyces zhihengii]
MSGPLWQEPGDHVDTLPALPRQRDAASRSGPAADPLDALAVRLHDVVAAAVHPDEIAAILESDGMTDDHIRLAYGRPDSFALAAALYRKVPRGHPEPPPPPAEPWHTGLLGSLLRGLLFALPGLGWLLAAPLLGEPRCRRCSRAGSRAGCGTRPWPTGPTSAWASATARRRPAAWPPEPRRGPCCRRPRPCCAPAPGRGRRPSSPRPRRCTSGRPRRCSSSAASGPCSSACCPSRRARPCSS